MPTFISTIQNRSSLMYSALCCAHSPAHASCHISILRSVNMVVTLWPVSEDGRAVAPTQTTYKTRKCLLKGEHCSGMCTGHDSVCNSETTPAAYKTRKCSLNGKDCSGMCTGHNSVCNSETNPATYKTRKCSLNGKDCRGMCTGHNSVPCSSTGLVTMLVVILA